MTRIVFEDVSKIYGDRPRQVQEAMLAGDGSSRIS